MIQPVSKRSKTLRAHQEVPRSGLDSSGLEADIAASTPLPRSQPSTPVANRSLSRRNTPPRNHALPNMPQTSRFVPQRQAHPPIMPCRSVYCYERLNQIEEGSYGVVFRAKDKESGEIVALKKLKLDEEKNGFPITSLREVMALMVCRHENVVGVREIVVGDTLTQ